MQRLFTVCVALLAAVWAPPVRADSYESALLDGVAARDRALETGNARDWRQALQHFSRAVEFRESKEALFEYAEAATRLELVGDAYAAYATALALGLQGRAAERARAFTDAHGADVSRLDLRGPPGALLYVDDRKRAMLPLKEPLVLNPGPHLLRLEQPAFQAWQQPLEAKAGATLEVEATLVAKPPTAPPAPVDVGTRNAGARNAMASDVPTSPAPWAKPLLVGGGALFVAGAAGIGITSALLPGARKDLRENCDGVRDGDVCRGVTGPKRSAAQSAADRITTYKALRWVGVASGAVGLAGAVLGLVQVLGSGTTANPTASDAAASAITRMGWQTPELWVSETGLALGWGGQF